MVSFSSVSLLSSFAFCGGREEEEGEEAELLLLLLLSLVTTRFRRVVASVVLVFVVVVVDDGLVEVIEEPFPLGMTFMMVRNTTTPPAMLARSKFESAMYTKDADTGNTT